MDSLPEVKSTPNVEEDHVEDPSKEEEDTFQKMSAEGDEQAGLNMVIGLIAVNIVQVE